MKNEDLSNISTEALEKRAKTLGIIVGIIWGAVITISIAGVMLAAQKGFNVFVTLPVVYIALAVLFTVRLKKIKAEIKTRATQ